MELAVRAVVLFLSSDLSVGAVRIMDDAAYIIYERSPPFLVSTNATKMGIQMKSYS